MIQANITPANSYIGSTPPKLLHIQKNIVSNNFYTPRILHKHDCLEITLITDGFCDYTLNDSHFYLSPGSIVICDRGNFHAENFGSPHGAFITILVTNINLPGYAPDTIVPPDIQPAFNAHERFSDICSLVNMMFQTRKTNGTYSEKIVHHLFNAFMLDIMTLIEEKPVGLKSHRKNSSWHTANLIKDYIDKNFCENLTLDQISNALNFSPSLVSHVFKQEVGYSPMQYVTMLRIGEAQTLLSNSTLPLTEIAGRLGYNTPENFYVMFRKNIGISPSQYRKHYASFQK